MSHFHWFVWHRHEGGPWWGSHPPRGRYTRGWHGHLWHDHPPVNKC